MLCTGSQGYPPPAFERQKRRQTNDPIYLNIVQIQALISLLAGNLYEKTNNKTCSETSGRSKQALRKITFRETLSSGTNFMVSHATSGRSHWPPPNIKPQAVRNRQFLALHGQTPQPALHGQTR